MNLIETSKLTRQKVESYLAQTKSQPITELPNHLTTNIDLAENGPEIVEVLKQTDSEIFDGWRVTGDLKSDGLRNDFYILDKLGRLGDIIRGKLGSGKRFKIVMSGCGTSGRLACLCSKTFNECLERDVCEYIIAGGDYALVNSVEAVEDKPDAGESELIKYMFKICYLIFGWYLYKYAQGY